MVIDGLFGIGLARPLEGRHKLLVERINSLKVPILALDIPSGLDSETGRLLGIAVQATLTATFIGLKPGMLTLDGPDHCGIVSLHDLGLPIGKPEARSVSPELFSEHLKPRTKNSHKGSYGSAGIIGGAPGMTGAALLAARAALKLGAGRVYVGIPKSGGAANEQAWLDPVQPELMLRQAHEIFQLATCLAIGPGLGQSDAALSLLRTAIDQRLPLVLDADAINLLAKHPVLASKLERRSATTLLTPHPSEAARLLGTDTTAVQADRVAAARALAERFSAAIVLKGCGSIVALPDGRWFINTSGNPGLSSAGSGDVLSGMIVALLAQNWPAEKALLAAVHLHGAAADTCVAADSGPIGLTASELIEPARRLLNCWVKGPLP
ncbi:MAG: NAD(P)H-hydrate dehydratase [Proteobacteria bacterium]|nr:NAD(P)H-hydrate dehydratase [Pseudomonadota bacterium]